MRIDFHATMAAHHRIEVALKRASLLNFGMNRRIAVLLFLVAGAAPVRSQCDTRPATAAEKSAHHDSLAAFRKAAAPAPAGWGVVNEVDLENLEVMCVNAETYPSKYSFSRRYSNTKAVESRQDGVNKKVAAAVAAKERRAASNAGKLAALDKKSEAIQKRLEAAISAGKTAELEALGKQMGEISEERARLDTGDLGAQTDAIAAEAARDTTADLSITSNVESEWLTEFKPATVAGAPKAFRQVLTDGPNPEDVYILLLGPWKVSADGNAEPSASLAGKPHTKIHTISVHVRGEAGTARALLAKLDLAALKALIGR